MTIPTFTKLFTTRIVPSSCSGFLRRVTTFFEALDLLFFKPAISDGESEKKATSDPEIRAEQIRSNSRIIKQNIIPAVGGWKYK